MRVIIDTSVLVAAARSRNGASYQLLSMLPSSDFEIALTVALYTEWQAVLTRSEHLPPGVTVDMALTFLRYLASLAHLQDVHFLWRPFLHDPDDDMVLECAMETRIKSPVRPELVEGLAVPIDCYRFNPIMVRQAHHERIKSAFPYSIAEPVYRDTQHQGF